MNRKLLRSNIAIFVLLVLGVCYVGFRLLRFDPVHPPYNVTVELERAGGLYAHSDVTYLGHPVGRVTAIRLRPGGVSITAQIAHGTEIPRDTRAVVAGLSPVGEQYLDFEPRTDDGPYLRPGDVIAASNTAVPVEFATMVRNVAALADQIDPAPIGTVLDELATGLGAPGAALNGMIDDAASVLAALVKTEPATVRLLGDGDTLLTTAVDLRPQLTRFSRAARSLTREMRRGGGTLRRILTELPPSLDQVMSMVGALQRPVADLVDSVDPVLGLLTSRSAAIRALLTVSPGLAGVFTPVIRGGWLIGTGYLEPGGGLCTYRDGKVQLPWIAHRPAFRPNEHCASHGDTTLQRGADNAPRP